MNSGSFSLRRDGGVSVGLASRIGNRFESFCQLKEEQGVARLPIAEILDLNLKVQSDPEPDWREFADAHCILSGYQGLPKKTQEDLGRKLRDIANANILKAPRGRIMPTMQSPEN